MGPIINVASKEGGATQFGNPLVGCAPGLLWLLRWAGMPLLQNRIPTSHIGKTEINWPVPFSSTALISCH